MSSENDLQYMQRAIELALRGRGKTGPNPLVGAVVVKDKKIVAEAFHVQAGKAHAEVKALNKAGKRASGATLYLNLEPCSHFGRTPPCSITVIKRQIKRVVIGTRDPNPLVCGRGIRKLKQAKIKVETGLLSKQCRKINEIYFKYIRKKMPYLILKAGVSLDGKIAGPPGRSRWITGPEARRNVQELRAEVDALLVGLGTVLKDNPRLTLRLKGGIQHKKRLKRIIVDSHLRIPLESKVLRNQPELTIIAAAAKAPSEKIAQIKKMGAEVLQIREKKGRVNLKILLEKIGERGISSVLLEGGAELNRTALVEGLVDKIVFFIAPRLIGGRDSLPVIADKSPGFTDKEIRLKEITITPLGEDFRLEGYIK